VWHNPRLAEARVTAPGPGGGVGGPPKASSLGSS